MLISEREAADLLDATAALRRTVARHLLRTGVAGAPVRSEDGRLLYDMDLVDAVGRRAMVRQEGLDQWAPFGVLQLRLGRDAEWQVAWDDLEKLERIGAARPTSLLRRVTLRAFTREAGFLPLVVTVSGFVVGGADVLEPALTPDGELVVGPPGGWFETVSETRWWPGRGGMQLQWHEP